MPPLLVSLNAIKRSLGIQLADLDQDVLLTEIENRAAVVAEGITNRSLVAVTGYVELTQGQGIPAIFARSVFIAKPKVELRNSVTEPWAELDPLFVEVDLGTPDTEERRRRIIRLSSDTLIGGANNFPSPGFAGSWFDNVRLTYDAGYSVPAAGVFSLPPFDLEQALLWMITATYRLRIKRTGPQTEDRGRDVDEIRIPALSDTILRRYTTARFASVGRLELA